VSKGIYFVWGIKSNVTMRSVIYSNMAKYRLRQISELSPFACNWVFWHLIIPSSLCMYETLSPDDHCVAWRGADWPVRDTLVSNQHILVDHAL